MKRNITKAFFSLFLVSSAAGFHVYAQPFTYTTGQQWNVYTIPTSTNKSGNTIIFHADNQYAQYAGNVYKIMYCDGDDIMDLMYGMYREDNGKIYMREFDSWGYPQEEHLLYDWNLNIGEVAYIQHGDIEIGLVLDAVTGTTINGEERRVFYLHYETDSNLTETWIEGMGSELGFPFCGTKNNPVSPFHYPMTTEMLCYYEDGELSWDNPNYDDCVINYWVDISEIEECKDITVYPNPAREVVTIKYEAHTEAEIEVYDTFGKTIYHGIMKDNEHKIDMGQFPNGLYVVLIQNYESVKHTLIFKY